MAQILKDQGASQIDERIIMKPTYKGDAQVSMIKLSEEETKKIGETLRIGWVECLVQPMVIPRKCYNCYVYGHLARECSKEKNAMKENCLNCNEKEHTIKNCKNTPKCRDCQNEGQRTGTMNCPLYRKLVRDGRKENYWKRDTASYVKRRDIKKNENGSSGPQTK